jgi:hypothetical protein
MRLRTKCSAHTIHGSTDDFCYDAAVAHALVQAIKEHFTALNFNYVQGEDDVSRRSDELLREWGWEVPDVGS